MAARTANSPPRCLRAETDATNAELEAELADEFEDDDLDRLDVPSRYVATPPFQFVGMEPTTLEIPGVDTVEPVDVERFLDANGRSVSMQDIYRTDFANGSEDRGDLADAEAQIEAAGYVKVPNGDGNGWHWELVDQSASVWTTSAPPADGYTDPTRYPRILASDSRS
ncbi:hypothetical protein [Mycolicibacterium tusciae]|uniref:hypothetical protein n=1 Tax=Mycolicibacterium tusciae TaxID=75922 RepID=UPI0010563ED3|nr:hypothetical protein [Mycolicibacterium tusciae]